MTPVGHLPGQDLDALRTWVNALPAFRLGGVVCVDLHPGAARATMVVDPRMRNGNRAVNGGVLSFFAISSAARPPRPSWRPTATP